MDQNCQKAVLVLTHLGIETFIPSTLPISFYSHQGVNYDSFWFEAEISFLNILKYDLYIGIEILIG